MRRVRPAPCSSGGALLPTPQAPVPPLNPTPPSRTISHVFTLPSSPATKQKIYWPCAVPGVLQASRGGRSATRSCHAGPSACTEKVTTPFLLAHAHRMSVLGWWMSQDLAHTVAMDVGPHQSLRRRHEASHSKLPTDALLDEPPATPARPDCTSSSKKARLRGCNNRGIQSLRPYTRAHKIGFASSAGQCKLLYYYSRATDWLGPARAGPTTVVGSGCLIGPTCNCHRIELKFREVSAGFHHSPLLAPVVLSVHRIHTTAACPTCSSAECAPINPSITLHCDTMLRPGAIFHRYTLVILLPRSLPQGQGLECWL